MKYALPPWSLHEFPHDKGGGDGLEGNSVMASGLSTSPKS